MCFCICVPIKEVYSYMLDLDDLVQDQAASWFSHTLQMYCSLLDLIDLSSNKQRAGQPGFKFRTIWYIFFLIVYI